MASTTNATIAGGTCSYYNSSSIARSCYDCANYVVSSGGNSTKRCMIDYSGLCVDRVDVSSAARAQLNRTYCERADSSCLACLKANGTSFTGLCTGVGNCFCLGKCEPSLFQTKEDDSEATHVGMYLGIAVGVLFVLFNMCRRRKKPPANAEVQVGSGYPSEYPAQPPPPQTILLTDAVMLRVQNTAPVPVGLPFPDDDNDEGGGRQRGAGVDSTSDYYNYSRAVVSAAPEERGDRDDYRDVQCARMGGDAAPSAPPLESTDEVDKAPRYARI